MMDDRNAFERQLADEVTRMAGPEPRFDAMAIARSAMTTPLAARRRVFTRLWGGFTLPLDDAFSAPMERSFTMFSALKFIAAGVIVALFGGFLLAGVLTTPQGEEVVPAAVTGSPEPEVTGEATESSDPSVRADILPGVALTVEEVGSGTYRVDNDGVRDLSYHPEQSDMGWRSPRIVAGDDGGIWVLQGDVYYRLGMSHAQAAADYPPRVTPDGVVRVADFEVAPDGTVWATVETMAAPEQAPEDALYLWSSDDKDGVLHMPTGPFGAPVEITPDGTVWAVWLADPEAGAYGRQVFGYLGADGWTAVGDWPDQVGSLSVTDAGEVWVPGRTGWGHMRPQRFVEGAWHQVGDHPVEAWAADVGPEGTLWGVGSEGSARFDGAEWMTFEPPDWLPTDRGGWTLVEDEWAFVSLWDYEAALEDAEAVDPATMFRASFPAIPWGEPHVAPDGSLWVPARLGVWGDRDQPVCDHGIDGVARHDGATWSRLLQGRCVEDMDIAADGSVWLLATESDARYPLIQTYVITPEVVAAGD